MEGWLGYGFSENHQHGDSRSQEVNTIPPEARTDIERTMRNTKQPTPPQKTAMESEKQHPEKGKYR